MSNNSAAKATLDVYQALFSTLDDYLSRTRFLEEVEMHDFTREVFMFFLDRGFDAGYEAALEEGALDVEAAYNEGYHEGERDNQDAVDEAHSAGYAIGYNEGYEDGQRGND